MYRGYRNRKKEAQSRAAQQVNMHTGPASQSSSSLSFDCTSSAQSSLLLATSSSDSGRSDILVSDHSVANCAPSTPPKPRFFPISLSPTSRTSSVAHMGQGSSRADSTSPRSLVQDIPSAAASATSLSTPSRLKRIWHGRRKKSEDVTSTLANIQYLSNKGRGRDHDGSASCSTITTPASSVDDLEVQHTEDYPRCASPAKQPLTVQLPVAPNVDSVERKHSRSPALLPLLPQTDWPGVSAKVLTQSNSDETREVAAPQISPLVSLNPGSAAAIHLMQNHGQPLSSGVRERADSEVKQDWRKSDSTVLSYVTIRPTALAGSRSPRPVSLAESSHSGHTIVPVNKRLSALITDAEYAMAEENDCDSESDILSMAISRRPSPASSVKARNRRSASLNFGSGYISQKALADSLGAGAATTKLSRTYTDTPLLPPCSRDTPTLSRTAASGILTHSTVDAAHSAAPNARSKLAVWASPPTVESRARHTPASQVRRPTPPTGSNSRPIAVTLGGALAPVALGFGRRAAEKVQRVWEGLSSASSSQPGSDSTARTPSRQSVYAHQSSIPGGWRSKRRTPETSSGSWSVASSIASSSESDALSTPPGPSLGICLRGPKRNAVGMSIGGGLVFGRELRACVRDTAVDAARIRPSIDTNDNNVAKPVEQRMLPAIVVRCYQHLMLWGLQEEGLFR